jgi:hypothetical protein
MYCLTRVNNRPAPEAFLKQLDKIEGLIPHSLWQSANWGRYLNAVKTEASLLVLLRGEEIRAWAIMTWGRPLKGFKYAYLQRGPVFREPADRDTLLKEIYSQEGDYLLIRTGQMEEKFAAESGRRSGCSPSYTLETLALWSYPLRHPSSGSEKVGRPSAGGNEEKGPL